MVSERKFSVLTCLIVLVGIFALAGCGQRPPVETTIIPSSNDTATPFVDLQASPTAADTATASPDQGTPLAAPTIVDTITPEATLLAPTDTTATSVGVAAQTATATLSPDLSGTVVPTATASITVTGEATVTLGAEATPGPTPCFGSISGTVVADLNKNGQAEAGEPGVMGAKLFLYNSTGVVGLYTTGNGQFYFPGLPAGTYTLTSAPPAGYSPAGQPSYQVDVKCGDTITQNILMYPANAIVVPTAVSRGKITPVAEAQGTPRASSSVNTVSSFKPFNVGAVYDIAGCTSITGPGLYRLAHSLTSEWDCIQIASDNVIFDCQGYSLNGTDLNGYGVVVHQIGNIFSQRAPQNIEIRNCQISKHKYGIFVDAANNLYVHDNDLSDNFRDTDARNFGVFLGLAEGGGIRLGTTYNALIANNTTNNNAIGIDVRTGSGVTVNGNTANGNTAWGVHFYNVQYSEISDNHAADNIRYCTWGNGTVGPGCDAGGIMLQSGSSKNIVKDNVITGSNGNGIFVKAHGTPCGDGNVISGNTVTGALYNAIELSFCRDNQIMGNHITNALDGIWLGFATNNAINAGNVLQGQQNHGVISWNSANNNVSTNSVDNSREGLYFYSSDYDRQQFYFVSGQPSDHASTGNCLCDNTLTNNIVAAIHLNSSYKNQITDNKLSNNGADVLEEGNTSGNIIRNIKLSGWNNFSPTSPYYASFIPLLPTLAQPAPDTRALRLGQPNALTVYDMRGNTLSHADFLRAIWTDNPLDSFDLRWFKWTLRISFGDQN